MSKIKTIICAALVLTILTTAVGCGKKEEAPTDSGDLSPSITKEELEELVDFEAAESNDEIVTAEDAEVVIPNTAAAKSVDLANPTSFRSTVLPDAVWDNTPISYGNDEFTLPDAVLMSDGSLGQLKISKVGLTVSVYETDNEIEDMAHGVAHMKETSCWAGNVGLAGHNRGVNTFFGQIHTLAEGDKIELTTALGTRIYTVESSQVIGENDWTPFGRTTDNRITLLTCIDNSPSQRLCVQAISA